MANPVTHLEKTIAGEVTPRTHLEHVIAEYGGGGGGGGFTPTTAQLAAMNSGITAEKLQADENNILSKIGASDYASQNTGGTVRVWTTTDGTDTILHIANEAPTP